MRAWPFGSWVSAKRDGAPECLSALTGRLGPAGRLNPLQRSKDTRCATPSEEGECTCQPVKFGMAHFDKASDSQLVVVAGHTGACLTILDR